MHFLVVLWESADRVCLPREQLPLLSLHGDPSVTMGLHSDLIWTCGDGRSRDEKPSFEQLVVVPREEMQ